MTAISIGMSSHSQLGAGYKYAQRSDSSELSFQHETSKAKLFSCYPYFLQIIRDKIVTFADDVFTERSWLQVRGNDSGSFRLRNM